MTREDSWEWSYDDHGEKWFTDLEEAKDKLLDRFQSKHPVELFRLTDGVWEVVS